MNNLGHVSNTAVQLEGRDSALRRPASSNSSSTEKVYHIFSQAVKTLRTGFKTVQTKIEALNSLLKTGLSKTSFHSIEVDYKDEGTVFGKEHIQRVETAVKLKEFYQAQIAYIQKLSEENQIIHKPEMDYLTRQLAQVEKRLQSSSKFATWVNSAAFGMAHYDKHLPYINAATNLRYHTFASEVDGTTTGFARLGVVTDFNHQWTHLKELTDSKAFKAKKEQMKEWISTFSEPQKSQLEELLTHVNRESLQFDRLFTLRDQTFQLISTILENEPPKEGQTDYHFFSLGLLNPAAQRFNEGFLVDEGACMQDMHYMLTQVFDGKKICYDSEGAGYLDKEGNMHLPKVPGLSEVTFHASFANVSVQGQNPGLKRGEYTEAMAKEQKVQAFEDLMKGLEGGTLARRPLVQNRDQLKEELVSLKQAWKQANGKSANQIQILKDLEKMADSLGLFVQSQINQQALNEVKSYLQANHPANETLLEEFERLAARFDVVQNDPELAEDMAVFAKSIGMHLSVQCLKGKDRTGLVSARIVQRSVEQSVYAAYQHNPHKARLVVQKFANAIIDSDQAATQVARDNTVVQQKFLKTSSPRLRGVDQTKRNLYYVRQAKGLFTALIFPAIKHTARRNLDALSVKLERNFTGPLQKAASQVNKVAKKQLKRLTTTFKQAAKQTQEIPRKTVSRLASLSLSLRP